MFGFDTHGTDGLELFTWIVAGLAGIGAGLIFAHFLQVNKKDKEEEAEH